MTYTIRFPNWNKGKEMVWDFPYDEKTVKQIVNEVFGRQDYKKGLNYIKKIKNPTVMDLGSYIGLTPIYFSSHKGTRVFAVEPHPASFKSLITNVKNYPNITAINYAIGLKEEPRSIAETDKSIGMSLYGNPGESRIPVQAINIEQLFTMLKIDHVDLLKVDIENAEYEVFLSEAFDRIKDRIDMIIGEAHNDILPYQAVKTILDKKGFKTTYLDIDNITSGYTFKLDSGVVDVDVILQSMFIAKRV